MVGFSLGANILGNYLGEEGKSNSRILKNLKAACCIQPPFKMWECGKNIKIRLFGIYNKVLG